MATDNLQAFYSGFGGGGQLVTLPIIDQLGVAPQRNHSPSSFHFNPATY